MSICITRRLLGLAALLLLVAPAAVSAQDVYLPNDTTLDATNPVFVPYAVNVGYASFNDAINNINPTSPTISIVNGANISALNAENSSIINMTGGDVGDLSFFTKLRASDTSTINVSGGNVVVDLDTQFASTANFSGGTVGNDIVTHDNSTVNMTGGVVDQDLLINDSSTFNFSGGTVLDNVFVGDNSLLNVFGTGLGSVLTDPNFQGFYSEYVLSGHLLDGTDLAGRTIDIQNGSGASFTLTNVPAAVPEPGILALLMGSVCGGSLLLRRKRQNSH